MEFIKYPDIENSYCADALDKVRRYDEHWSHPKWAVQVKIDGGNLQVAIDRDDNILIGCRSCELGEGASFYAYKEALEHDHIIDKIKSFNAAYKEMVAHPYQLVFFGELCGGKYAHKDVKPVPNQKAVQKRISYAPFEAWICYDIFVRNYTGDGSPWKRDETFLAPDTVETICREHDIPFVSNLAVVTLDEALAFDTRINDTTGNRLWNLPVIEDNEIEGVVIKPMLPYKMPSGQWPFLKIKNEKFKERMKHHEKKPDDWVPTVSDQVWLNSYTEYMTDSRMCSVMSKLTSEDKANFGTLLRAFKEDMDKDMTKDGVPKTEPDNMDKCKKHLGRSLSDFVRPYFLKGTRA
jgi:Rnl2 family RNA ligase